VTNLRQQVTKFPANTEIMEELVAMGFDPDLVRQALDECDNNHDLAIEILLTFGGDHSEQNHYHQYQNRLHEDSSQNKSDHDIHYDDYSDYLDKTSDQSLIVCDTSQYTIENGKSACTCIALAAATQFFEEPWSITTPRFLQDMIFQGVIIYNQLVSSQPPISFSSSASSSSSSLTCSSKVILPSVEHMSAEEILHHHPHSFPLCIVGDISQGVLSHDYNHPLGLKSRLEALIASYYNADDDDDDDDFVNVKVDANRKGKVDVKRVPKCIVVLLTKTPETVLICHRHYPLSDGNYSRRQDSEWILIDSHPRPPVSSHAYARRHYSIDDLVRTIHTIFPPTNLDPDIPEMMTMLYNSFDLYQLEYDRKDDQHNND
jgi:hypothetical protein